MSQETILSPQEYASMFHERRPLPSNNCLQGVIGRFIRGVCDEDFLMLSDEPGKKLSWVCTEDLLSSILGKSPAEALLYIGKPLSWLENRLRDGTIHKLVVFPAEGGIVATWDNVFSLIKEFYGENIHQKLEPFHDSIKRMTSFSDEVIAGASSVIEIAELPVSQKFKHPNFMTADKYMSLETPTLLDARAFYYHSIGCNRLFLGNGTNADGKTEMFVPNKLISEIPGAHVITLDVTLDDIMELKR